MGNGRLGVFGGTFNPVHTAHLALAEEVRELLRLDRVLFVGGGTVALAEHIRDWFPNQAVAEHPAFANARASIFSPPASASRPGCFASVGPRSTASRSRSSRPPPDAIARVHFNPRGANSPRGGVPLN